MSSKKRIVITPLGGLFNLPFYWDGTLDAREKELISMKFMLYYNETNFMAQAIPTLAALMTLGNMKLVIVDGYGEPVFFRRRVVIATLIRNILPEKTTLKLLEANLRYIKVDTESEFNETFLQIEAEGETEGFEIINLRNDSWDEYAKKEFPELFPDPEESDGARH